MSVLTGVLVWLFAAAYGLNLALEWGVIAFTLNFIPVIGPVIATLFPSAFAHRSARLMGIRPVRLCRPQHDPVRHRQLRGAPLSGSALALSPSAVLFAVLLLGLPVGIFGAFIVFDHDRRRNFLPSFPVGAMGCRDFRHVPASGNETV